MSKKIATVIGATGNQGSAFISVLLQKAEYHIRGVTRNPDSDASNALKENGIEMVRGDLTDEASLKSAFEGSHLIFGVTDFVPGYVEHGGRKGQEIEANYGLNIARAAQATTALEHFIWSTLPGIHNATGGKFSCPNFDGKNQVSEYIRADAALLAKTTFLMIGWYETNFKYPVFTPIWVELANKYVVIGDYPADASLPCIGDVRNNLVPFLERILEQPEKVKNGIIVLAYIENVGFEDLLKRWARAHGKEAVYVKTSHETISQALWPRWTDLAEMARFMGDYKGNNWIYHEDEVLTAKKLGIPQSDFVPLSESLKLLKFD
ncbi:NAD(P)-binding protein [Trichoderma citrinoviride]|uniref:NAD(P)-binding protein n=1 Tax=Trichoderma citrinoviride TaxID=58853 RepID=A0A2T4BEH9_9HYPO|nr:NAD(P)-binding protein [Trichoderma citrinoviride]PTB67747.1 NAD(P)-binding protein [Trichoderma citrinoviride]